MQKVYRLIIIGVLMSALGSLGLSAQIKGYNIVVSVTPDHQTGTTRWVRRPTLQ